MGTSRRHPDRLPRPLLRGPTVVVYPEAVWYAGVAAADVPEIVDQHMRRGAPVTRLIRNDTDEGE